MESLARDKFNKFKTKFFNKNKSSPGLAARINADEDSESLLEKDNSETANSPDSDSLDNWKVQNGVNNNSVSDESDNDSDSKAVAIVKQKFNSLKSKFFNNKNASFTPIENGNDIDSEQEDGLFGKKETSLFKENFQKLKNKLFKDDRDSDEYIGLTQSEIEEAQNKPVIDFFRDSHDINAHKAVLTKSTDLRDLFNCEEDSEAEVEALLNGDLPHRSNFFDSCPEDYDDDTEVELFTFPEEKCK